MDDGINTETSLLLQNSHTQQNSLDEFSSLYKFLERPVLVKQGIWADTDKEIPLDDFDSKTAFSSRLYNGSFPTALLESNPAIVDKLNNFALLRADVKVQIKINSQPFQCGKLWLAFTPFQDYVDPASLEVKSYKGGITGFPGVEIDLATSNSGVLSMPFCSFREAYNLITGTGEFGNFDLWVLLPLRSGSVSYSIYANLENISLSVPAPSGDVLKKYKLKPQAQGLFRTEDKSSESSNVLSGIASTVGTVAGAVSNIPVIGKLAKPVSWAANAASGVLGALGFSKPENTSSSTFISWKPAKSLGFTEGGDDSTILSCLPDNSLEFPNKIFPTDVDEMSFNYIKSRPTVCAQGTWSTSTPVGNVLRAITVSPTYCPAKDFDAGKTYFSTMLAYLSNPASYWRGGMTYRLAFAKTAFHSGRLRISYWPFSYYGATEEMQNAYNVILDLRESSEITFTIPYVSSLPWQKVDFGEIKYDINSTGTVAIEVLNELVVTGQASATIDYIITIAGAEDFELSGWGLGDYSSVDNVEVPAIEELSLTPPPKAQIYEHPTNHTNIDPANSMNLLSTLSSSDYAKKNCIGENVESVRSLIKRFGYLGTITTPISSLSGLVAPVGMLNDGTFKTWLPEGNVNGKNLPFLQYFSNIYRFYRGSERFKLYHVGNTADNAHVRTVLGSQAICPAMAIQTYQNGSVTEITRPYYHGASKRVVFGTTQEFRDVLVYASGFLDGTGHLYGAAGDDFAFGWLIGPNPLVVYSGNATTNTVGAAKPVATATTAPSANVTVVGCVVPLPVGFGTTESPTLVTATTPFPVSGNTVSNDVNIVGCEIALPIGIGSLTTPTIVNTTNPMPTTGGSGTGDVTIVGCSVPLPIGVDTLEGTVVVSEDNPLPIDGTARVSIQSSIPLETSITNQLEISQIHDCEAIIPIGINYSSSPQLVTSENPIPVKIVESVPLDANPIVVSQIQDCDAIIPIGFNFSATPQLVTTANPLPVTSAVQGFGMESIWNDDFVSISDPYFTSHKTLNAGDMLSFYLENSTNMPNSEVAIELQLISDTDPQVIQHINVTNITSGTNQYESNGYFIVTETGSYFMRLLNYTVGLVMTGNLKVDRVINT